MTVVAGTASRRRSRSAGRSTLVAAVAIVATCGIVSACGVDPDADARPTEATAPSTTSRVAETTTTPSVTSPPSTSTSTTTTAPVPKSAVAPTFPPASDPPRTVDATTPVRIHTLGDSTAFSIGWGVAGAAGASGLATATVDARTSTGLTRNDYFDWPAHLLTLVLAPPEVAVISFGANDSQPLVRPDGSVVEFGAPGWTEEYERRIDGVLALLTGLGTRVYWVGQPVARDPAYTARMEVLDAAYRAVVARYPGATYVDATHWLTDDAGAYTETLPGPDGQPVELRNADGIHLSTAGGDYLGAVVLNRILADYGVAR